MSYIEEAAINQITPLVSIVNSSHGNISAKGNTTYIWNQSKLCSILTNLSSICKYLLLSYEGEKSISLKSTKFETLKTQRCFELLSFTMEGVWKERNEFKIEILQRTIRKRPESGDNRDLYEVVTIPIPEEIVQSDKRDLEDIEIFNFPKQKR